MTDIFSEIQDDLRRDRLGRLWSKYGNWIVALVVLAVLATGGWQGWRYYRAQQAQESGARFEAAVQMAREGKTEEADKALEALAKDGTGGYRLLARFRDASAIATRDPEKGIEAWRALSADSSVGPVLQDLAKLRAGFIAVDRVGYDALLKDLEPLTAPQNAWRNEARELLGVSALKAGNMDAAGRWFDQAVVDPEAPQALRQRVEAMSALVRGGPVTLSQ